MNTQTEVWLLFFLTAILTGIVCSGLVYAIWWVSDRLKTWIVINDEDGGVAHVGRFKVTNGTVTVKKKGQEPMLYHVHAKSRKTTGKGGLYIVDRATGINLTGPSTAQLRELAATETGGMNAKLIICDPEFAFHTVKTRVAQDFLRAREDKEHWLVKVAPLAFIALIALIGVVAFMGWKLSENGGG